MTGRFAIPTLLLTAALALACGTSTPDEDWEKEFDAAMNDLDKELEAAAEDVTAATDEAATATDATVAKDAGTPEGTHCCEGGEMGDNGWETTYFKTGPDECGVAIDGKEVDMAKCDPDAAPPVKKTGGAGISKKKGPTGSMARPGSTMSRPGTTKKSGGSSGGMSRPK